MSRPATLCRPQPRYPQTAANASVFETTLSNMLRPHPVIQSSSDARDLVNKGAVQYRLMSIAQNNLPDDGVMFEALRAFYCVLIAHHGLPSDEAPPAVPLPVLTHLCKLTMLLHHPSSELYSKAQALLTRTRPDADALACETLDSSPPWPSYFTDLLV